MSPNTIPVGPTSAAPQKPVTSGRINLSGRNKVTIGRGKNNDLSFPYPSISEYHAQIILNTQTKTYLIEDLKSLNGTFVNGKRVFRQFLHQNDIIQIGPVQLVYQPGALQPRRDQSKDISLAAVNLKQVVSGNRNLLQDVSIVVQPREFVALVGASGAGKSTLLNALSGFKAASDGKVYVNGDDLYENYDSFRSQIGYVPQKNIIHSELTVYEALDYSARLRLPPDTAETDRKKRIDDLLVLLKLSHRKDMPVHKLSGGEQKRVSIGVEYLTHPGLFFLDEATSGLDPGTETEIMSLLRQLADQGHTVIIVTHATKNIAKCHKVAFLANGYMAFYGSPAEALTYFGKKDFDEIYSEINKYNVYKNARQTTINHENAAVKFKKDPLYYKNVQSRLPAAQTRRSGHVKINRGNAASSFIGQFGILSQRNIDILKRDKKSLALMLLIAPIIGMMFFLFWNWGMLDKTTGNARFVLTNLFMTAVVCCLVGALSSMREIVKEAEIYRRERMVFLNIIPYVLSKIWVAILISLYSATVFLVFLELAGAWPPTGIIPAVLVTMFLAVLGGSAMGLLISSISDNQNITPLLLVLILVPQLIFGGIIPSSQIKMPGQAISNLTSTKWAFESLVKISGIGDSVISDPSWAIASDATHSAQAGDCPCKGENIFTKCNFPGIMKYYVREINEPEPLKPDLAKQDFQKPGDPPTPPYVPTSDAGGGTWQKDIQNWTNVSMKNWQDKVTKYQNDVKKYELEVNDYRDNKISVWQNQYQRWKETRSKAIGEAEGTIKAVNDDYGTAFRCDVASNWLILVIMICSCLVLVLLMLKWKDSF